MAATFPTLAPGTGWAMDELAPARQLRAGGRRPHRHGRRRREAGVGPGRLPVVRAHAGGGGHRSGAGGGGGAGLATVYDLVASSLTRPTTSTPPLPTAGTWPPRSPCGPSTALARARAGTQPELAAIGDAGISNRRKFGRGGGSEGRTVSQAPCASPADLHEVVVTVNGVARSARAGTPAAVRHAPPRPAPDRDPRRLRARRVRRLHGAAGWRAHPLVPMTFAVMVDGARITTVEGLAGPDGELGPVQRRSASATGCSAASARRASCCSPPTCSPAGPNRPTTRSATPSAATCAAAPATSTSCGRSAGRRS